MQPLQIFAAVTTAVTTDGQAVLLKEDGTYEYLNKDSTITKKTKDDTYQSMSMIDLQIDMATIRGKKIRILGNGMYIVNGLIVADFQNNHVSVLVDIENIPREQKKKLIQNCGGINSLCPVMIVGTIGTVAYQDGIIADAIEFK